MRYTEGVTMQSKAAERFAQVASDVFSSRLVKTTLLVYSFAERYEDMETTPSMMEAAVKRYFARFTELSYMPWMSQRQAYKASDWGAYNTGLRVAYTGARFS